jgi:hypothetical protein
MKLHILLLVVLGIVFVGPSIANAQTPSPSPIRVTVTRAWLQGNENRSDAGFGDRILVEVEHMAEAIKTDKLNPHDLVLFLNGQALKGLKVAAIETAGPANEHYRLAFDLKRTTDSDQVWRALLGSPTWKDNYRAVDASVGFPEKEAFTQSVESYRPVIYLRLYNRWWAVGSLIFWFVVLGFFIAMAKVGNVIRDSEPPKPPPGAKKPYSLALTQAAWWFFLVIGSFVFIYLITGDYNTMTDQALILMGIGTGTALGSFMINATKRDTANTDLSTLVPQRDKLAAEVAALNPNADAVALAEKQAQLNELNLKIADAQSGLSKPVSEGLRKDLLTDVNGIALHRFQMVIWTIVLGLIFLIGVYRDLAMPAFSGTLLALMGISAGTYLGFKIPERQN